jgi:mannose-6-phosphate isomerase-like protein (cupin superfamily)
MSTQATAIRVAIRKNAQTPDVTRTFPNGRVDYVHLEDRALARVTLQPGWKWSNDVRPLEGTPLCQTSHLQYVVSGRLTVEMEDKTRLELSAGDFALIPPGHDAWVEGEEPFVAIDFSGQMKDYATPKEERMSWLDAEAMIGY